MRRAVCLLVVLLLLPGVAVEAAKPGSETTTDSTTSEPLSTTTSSTSYLLRGPIVIRSDADFTAANGVVAGTGNESDPYVIAGWHITASTGTAITITNVSRAFVVRDNLLEAHTALVYHDARSVPSLVDNDIHVSAEGIRVTHADALVANNTIHFTVNTWSVRAIYLYASSARVETNYIETLGVGIQAEQGAPAIVANDIHHPSIGIRLDHTSRAHVEANIVTVPRESGIYVSGTIRTTLEANLVVQSDGTGIEAWANKDVEVHNNTVRASARASVVFETSSGNVTGNLVIDGHVDGIVVWHSPLLIANNTIENHLGIALHFQMSAATAEANVLLRNGLGIALHSADIVHLRANVLANNTVGISVPYEARQSIHHMEANLVNGVNVDGALDASQRVFFYKAANVSIVGQVRDSGFSAGYYGSLTAQGGVVLYEVDTANIEASVVSHHNIGVGVVNSFNVNVRGSLLANNLVGVRAEARSVGFQVPNCALFVKDTNITIDLDPVATFGIDSSGCATLVLRTNVSIVDTGIRITGGTGAILNASVTNTTAVGIELSAVAQSNVSGTLVASNAGGILVRGGASALVDNRIAGNARYGVRLEQGADVDLLGNNVSANGQGVIDTRACIGPSTCSRVDAEGNVFVANRGDGLRVNGTSSLRGDAFLDNRGAGARLGSATIVDVRAHGNEESGLVSVGTFTVRGALATHNVGSGFTLVGSGSIRDSTFTHNGVAGIRATATYVVAYNLNVSRNFDGILFDELVPRVATPETPDPSVPGLWRLVPVLMPGSDPLDVHRSLFTGNARDAIRAGGAVVNATHNYFGPLGPRVSVADTVGAFGNGVSPTVRVVPWYTDPEMTTTGPAPLL